MHHLLPVKLLALFVSLVLLTACEQPAQTEITVGNMPAEKLSQLVQANSAPVILDVRSAAEYDAGHIPGAINIPHTQLADRLDELPADRSSTIVVHCQVGRRAGVAESMLVAAGFSGLQHLEGDYAGWDEAGYPLVQPLP